MNLQSSLIPWSYKYEVFWNNTQACGRSLSFWRERGGVPTYGFDYASWKEKINPTEIICVFLDEFQPPNSPIDS